jgi:crotonobetainyl-CoA:carnitine CoA-transferase CaiB-like acyl-CoA transferase
MSPVAPSSPSLLSEVSVLDLSIWRPGPYATSLLVGLGADVVKVEPPGGDPMRHYPELFKSVNAGKRSIMLDLKEPHGAGRRRALELAGEADVIVEGFRPGVMARLGLGEPAVRALNAGVVYCSISGYGQQGPLAVAPGHDLNYQAWAGALAPDGGAAVMPPLPLADLASGMTAAFGICAALLGRGAGGPGTYLDISMTDVMATWTGSASSVSDEDPVGGGGGAAGDGDRDGDGEVVSGSRGVPGYGLFATADGRQVALGVVNEQHFWSALCIELGLADLGGLSFSERLARSEELAGAVTDAIGSRRRDDLVSSLLAAGVPAAPVLDRAGMIANGPFPGFPIRLGGAPGPSPPPAPSLDQHRGQGFRRARSG